MARKKETQPTIIPFKQSKTDFWVAKKHYTLKNGEIKIQSGGMYNEKEAELLRQYLKL